MGRNAPLPGHNTLDSWIGALTHVVIWLSLAGAFLLLAWFVAVLHDSTERGDQRRLQQSMWGESMFTESLRTESKTPVVR